MERVLLALRDPNKCITVVARPETLDKVILQVDNKELAAMDVQFRKICGIQPKHDDFDSALKASSDITFKLFVTGNSVTYRLLVRDVCLVYSPGIGIFLG